MRPAEPGEFTRRAFLNGKLDLVEAEALADLIAAETEGAAAAGLRRRRRAPVGALSRAGGRELIELRAQIEAELDFSDEEDVPGTIGSGVWETIGRLRRQMARAHRRAPPRRDASARATRSSSSARRTPASRAFSMPLAGRDVAIVADEPGTTRDAHRGHAGFGRVAKVRLIDTAGLRDNAGRSRRIGIARTQALARDARSDLSRSADAIGTAAPAGRRRCAGAAGGCQVRSLPPSLRRGLARYPA